MDPIDYSRSFSVGTADFNEVRLWIESRTRIIDEETGSNIEYRQAASCKSENTFADEELFMEDNYDFLPIFGPDQGVIFRRHSYLNSDYRDEKPVDEMWGGPQHHLAEPTSITELKTDDDIFEATHEMHPLVAQTEIRNEQSRLRAIIEYPVKTMNVNREISKYQIDTGPVAFPDLTNRYDTMVESLSLAFVAFNSREFADFVLEVPTPLPVADDIDDKTSKVYHYSKRISLEADNRIYAVK